MNKALKAGVMGWPVEHSLSPRLHTYWLQKYGIEGTYEALAVPPAELAAALKSLPGEGYSGVNLTIPHKEAATVAVDSLDEAAEQIGAVNTVVVRNGKLEGGNTDAYGFAENLRAHGVNVKGKPVVMLGAGGAARAVLAALAQMGAQEIRIANRNIERAEALAAKSKIKCRMFGWTNYHEAFDNAALLVNATSLGMQGQPPLGISLKGLPSDAVVTDLVYAPLQTALLFEAARAGHKTVDGLGMLLHQARPAFAAFFGVDPDVTDDLRAYVLGRN